MPKVGEVWAEIGARTDSFERGLDRATRRFDVFAQRMGRVGTVMSAAVTVPLLAFGRAAVTAASDAEESRSKFQAVFKNLAPSVEAWAKTHARAVGRSSSDWVRYLASVQDTLVPLGFAREEAAEMSKQVVQLSEDLASFNNLRTDDVVQRLTSSLVGNVENLRAFGVVANEAQIKLRAFRDGIIRSTKDALTPQQKALTILRLTMEGTTDAQGDLARTADSHANKVRALESSFKELKETIGARLLPPLITAADAVKKFVDSVNDLDKGNLDRLTAFYLALIAAGPTLKLLSKIGVGGAALVGFTGAMTAAEMNKSRDDAVGVFSSWFADGLLGGIKKVSGADLSSIMSPWFASAVVAGFGKVRGFGDRELSRLSNIGEGALSLLLSSREGRQRTTTPTATVDEGVTLATQRFLMLQRFGRSEFETIAGRGTSLAGSAGAFADVGMEGMAAQLPIPTMPAFTEGMKKAEEAMVNLKASATESSVRLAMLGADFKRFGMDVLTDFSFALGDAVASVVVFGDTLKQTLENIGRGFLGNVVSGVVGIASMAAINAIPGVAALRASLQGAAMRPDTSGVAGLSARLSLGDIVIEQQRTATRNNLNLVGLR